MADVDFSALTYAQIKQVYFQNLNLRSLQECDNLLAAIDALDIYRPTEADHAGERIALRDLAAARQRAAKRRGVYLLAARPPISIVPQDDLR